MYDSDGVPLVELGPGAHFGEDALLHSGPSCHTHTAVALVDCELQVMHRRQYQELLGYYSELASLMSIVAQVRANMRSTLSSSCRTWCALSQARTWVQSGKEDTFHSGAAPAPAAASPGERQEDLGVHGEVDGPRLGVGELQLTGQGSVVSAVQMGLDGLPFASK